jgi:predicted DNA-binding protein
MPTSIHLDPEMEARLEKSAKAAGHSKLHIEDDRLTVLVV